MNSISTKGMVLLLSIALIVSMIPMMSYAETESSKKTDVERSNTQVTDIPFSDILSQKLKREEITEEKQEKGYATYSFDGNRKLAVFEDGDQISSNGDSFYLGWNALTDILSGKYVESARFYLYEKGNGSKNTTFGIYPVSETPAKSTNQNAIPRTEKKAAARASLNGTENGECVFNVTDLVRSLAEGKAANNGVVIKPASEDEKAKDAFFGCDAKDSNYRPKLAVTYYDGPSAPKTMQSEEYVRGGQELKVNWTGLRAVGLSKIQYSISSEKKGEKDPAWKDLPGKYAKEDVKKVEIPGTDSLSDGNYTLLLRGIDSKGREGDSKKLTFTVDGTQPSLSDVTVGAEKSKKRYVHRVRWNAADANFRNVTITVDGRQVFETESEEDGSYDIPNDALRGGAEHQIVVTATDRAGNSTSQTRSYTYEGASIEDVEVTPATSLDHPSNEDEPTISFGVWEVREVEIYLELDDELLESWNRRGHKEYTVPAGILTESGSHTFTITAYDDFDNESVETVKYYYDAGPPVIDEVTITPETSSGSPSFDRRPVVTWSVQEYNLDKVQYRVGNGSWNAMGTTLTGSFRIPQGKLSSGDNAIGVRAVDTAGNTSTVSNLHYYLDTSPSRSDFTVTDLSVREYYGKAVLSWNAAAASSDVKVSVHRGTSANFTPSASTLAAENISGTNWIDSSCVTGTVYYKVVSEALTGSWVNDPLISAAVQYTSPLSSGSFTNRTGNREYLPYYDFTAPMGEGTVEESSGNLLYSQEDYSLTNDHFSYGLTRTYNSRDVRSGMLGRGWSDSYHRELYKSGNDIYFIDTDGSCYLFEKVNGSYSCAETKDYTLTAAGSGYTLEDKDHIVTTFNDFGQMTEQREPNGCSLRFVYSPNGTISSVISNTGLTEARVLALTYDTTNPYLLSVIDLFDESQLEYTITSGKLTKVRHKKGNDHIDWDYSYDGSGNMTSLTDGEENAYSFAWSNGKVSTLTYPDLESAQFTYGNGTTSVTGKTPGNDTLYTMSAGFDTSTGKVTSETGKDGQTTQYDYNAPNPYLVTAEKTTVYYQSLSGNTVSFQSHASVNEIAYTYDSDENITREETSDGEATDYTYDNLGRLTEETTSIGTTDLEIVEYTYCEDEDSNDDVTEIYNVETESESVTGEETEYIYDDRGNVCEEVTSGDGEVSAVSTMYDSQGDPEEECADDGTISELVTQETVSIQDPMGRVICSSDGATTVETEYDFMGRDIRVEETTAGVNGSLVTTKTYTDNGALASVTDPRGLTTTYTYDSMNRCIREHKSGSGITAQDSYTEYGYAQNVSTTDGRTQKSYSACSTKTLKNTAEEIVSVTYLDGAGTVVKEVKGTQFTDYSYDGSRNRYAVYDGNTAGNTHQLRLELTDEKGNAISTIRNPSVSGNTYSAGTGALKTRTTYNEQGEVASETDENGIVTTFSYDDEQRITEVTVGSGNTSITRTVTYTEDGYGTTTETTDPGGKVTRQVVNTAGLTVATYDIGETSMGNPTQIGVTYGYDGKGRVIRESCGSSRVEYVYDEKARVEEKKWYSGSTLKKTIQYTYNLFGDLSSATCYEGNAVTSQASFTYDILGRKTSEETTYSNQTSQTVQYSYDAEGNLSQLTYPNAAQGVSALSYTYDSWGRLEEISNGNDVLREVTYDGLGRQASVTDRLSANDDVTTSYSYDSLGRLLTSTAMKGNAQVEKLTYAYSGSRISQRREETAFPGTTSLDETRQYTYDDLGRLTSTVIGTDTIDYSYDSAGNRTEESTADQEKEYIYNSLDQIEDEYISDLLWYEDQEHWYSYDTRGNVLAARDPENGEGNDYTWTVDDLLISVRYHEGNHIGGTTTLASMEYDYEGKRIGKSAGNETTQYVYANGKVITAGSTNHTATNVYAGNETVGAYHGSAWYDYLADPQGSTMGILKQDGTTAAAYTYSDLGETEARYGSTFRNEICYTGSIYDWETGEYYLNARYYNPESASFLSRDTYQGDADDFRQWNIYAYCANDPVNYRDPSGHYIWALPIFWTITGGILSAYIASQAAKSLSNIDIGFIMDDLYAMAIGIATFQTGAEQYLTGVTTSIKRSRKDDKNKKKHNHHIVAKKAKRAKRARKVLKKAGVSNKNKHNIVRLKQHFHSRLHRRDYYDGVNIIMESGDALADFVIKEAGIDADNEETRKSIKRACCYACLAGLKGTLKAGNVFAH